VESGVTYLLINSKMAQWMGRLTVATLVHGEWGENGNSLCTRDLVGFLKLDE
jgi:hypothetical protein